MTPGSGTVVRRSPRRPEEGVWSTAGEELLGAPVAAGVWVTALPFPTPLRFSCSYLVETDAGLVVVDLGWDSDDSWQRFLTGLSRAGKQLDDVSGIVVTHAHPDHYGLAARLRSVSDAWIALHPGEQPALAVDEAAARRRLADMAAWLVACGADAEEIDSLHAEAAEMSLRFPNVRPDLDLKDGAPIPETDGSLVAVHTPGHTPGSVCFVDRGRGLVFTGDHVLPRVTPNISKRPTSDEDPLADYLRSLHRLSQMDGAPPAQLVALPGHEWGFGGLGERSAEIDAHHAARLEEMATAVRAGHDTVWAVAHAVSWSRPFADLPARARRSAIGETHAHLHRLYRAGTLRWIPGQVERWEAMPARPGPAPEPGSADTGRTNEEVRQG